MEKEDKIAFTVLSAIAAGVIFAILFAIRFVGISVFGWFAEGDSVGIGFRSAFIYGTALSALLMIVFAIFAGDGVLGELPTMVIAFFVFLLFFTFSIAWLF